MNKYITVQGDMWDSIAKKVYGDERHMNLLLQQNRDYRDYVIFPADIALQCPTVNMKKSRRMPPWKK